MGPRRTVGRSGSLPSGRAVVLDEQRLCRRWGAGGAIFRSSNSSGDRRCRRQAGRSCQRRGGAFVIDVGATRFPPVPSLDADQVQITEDARGTLFTARMPMMHTTGPAVIDGAVTLDRLSLPARLVADHDGVSLQFFVSGLAGESTISTRFGAAPAAPSGLNLVITGTGEIGVAPTPPPPPPPPRPRPPKPTKKAVAPKPAPMLTRLRRAVPAPLEPMARRLSRNHLARRLYRRMTQS